MYILRAILLFIVLARAQKTRQRLVDKAQQKSTLQVPGNEQPPPYQDNETIDRNAGR